MTLNGEAYDVIREQLLLIEELWLWKCEDWNKYYVNIQRLPTN